MFGEAKTLHIVTFSRNMAMMLEAGQSLDKIINTQTSRTHDFRLRSVLAQMGNDLAAGHRFPEALANQEAYFGPHYVSLVAAGDASGKLVLSLQKAAEALEWGMRVRKKLRGLMVYPIVISFVLVVDVAVFIGGVLPLILDAMKDAINASSPLWLHVAMWVSHGGWVCGLAAIVAVAAAMVALLTQTYVGRRLCQETAVSIPILCDAVQAAEASYFLMSLLMTYSAGLSLPVGVELGVKSLTNEVIQEQFEGVEETLARQGSLTAALEETGAFPVDVIDMLATGEESGSLEKMLSLSLQYLERELDNKIELLMAILKPVILVVMVLLFGAVFLGMYLTIFSAFGALLEQTTKGIFHP
jgi:type IV pilus assembly protein PilC